MSIFGKDSVSPPERRAGLGPEAALSIISGGVRIVGDIHGAGILKVDGSIEGSIRGSRQVFLGQASEVHGDISTAEAVIAGRVLGSVFTSVRLELQPTAIVDGDIETKSIVVLEGARINGSVKMAETARISEPASHKEANSGGNPVEAGVLRLAN
jgi:cytoskeletal protein CcmA (bactofilin family)